MNKKFLSAVLFGALMVTSTGTFVSCKDYDDDIDSLQEQIDKLATKEDMTSQIAALQSALDAAKTEAAAAKASAEEAVKKATSAESTATDAEKAAAQAALDAANAKAEAIKAAQDEVAKVKAELEAAIDSKFEASKKELAETIAELTKKVEEMTGYTTGMVTGISFETVNDYNATKWDSDLDVNYARVSTVTYPDGLKTDKNGTPDGTAYQGKKNSSSYEFGKGLTGAFIVKAGDVNTVADKMLVKIDPVNATFSADMLSLMNGKGQNLNDYITITSDVIGTELKRTRGVESTGLRLVGVQLKNTVDFEAFDKLVLPNEAHHATSSENCKHGYIGYALTATDSKGRIVTSPYDVTLHVMAEKEAKNVKNKTYIYSSADRRGSVVISKVSDGKDATTSDEECYAIASGESFQITVGAEQGRVMASYVVVDYDYAGLSVADKTALKAMTYEGVNEVRKDGQHDIKVSGAAGIPVPLKLVTIDYTGTIKVNMVWVKAGEPARMEVAYTFTPKEFVQTPEAWSVATGEKVAFTVPANAATYAVSLTVGEEAHQGDNHKPVVYGGEKLDINSRALTAIVDNGTVPSDFLKLYKSDKTSIPSKPSEIAYAEFNGKVNLQMMKENQAYTGTVKFYDETGTFLGTNTIKVTKVLPTVVPSDFSAKTNGIVNGVLTAYPRPNENGITNVYYMKRAFNNWTPYYELAIDGLTNKKVNNVALATYEAGNYKGDNSTARVESINADYINNGTAYASTVKYNYGNIQYIPEGHGTETPGAYKVTWATSFSTKFNCWPVDCQYQWYETPVVYYREKNVIKGSITKDKDGKVTAFTNVIKAITPYKGTVDPFDAGDKDWTDWAKAFNTGGQQNVTITLITNNSGKEVKNEYFNAKFEVVKEGNIEKNAMVLTPTGAEVQVGNDVETSVVLTITDEFGHKHDIPALKFTMKINHE